MFNTAFRLSSVVYIHEMKRGHVLDNQAVEVPNTAIKQKYLGAKGLAVLLALLGAFIPLSIDMYLPALPGMAEALNASIAHVNLTLAIFFIFYAFSMLFWGPLSDKYGRKKILRTGLAIYCFASIMCALSDTVSQLILFRALQAVGGAGATSVSMAIVKDVYHGRARETVLAAIQSMIILAPVIAPVLGAFILTVTSWHGIFWTLVGFGVFAFVLSFLLEETSKMEVQGNLIKVIGRLFVVLKNPGFSSLLLIFSVINIPFMAFIASSSYIYIDGFGLSEQTYSYFYASNAVFAMLGPMLYLRLSSWFQRRSIIIVSLGGVVVGGVLILNFAHLSPWLMALTIIPATICTMVIRPPSANLMLEQQESDTGSASSLISFAGLTCGSIGMLLISLDWPSYTFGLGILYITFGTISSLSWLLISRRSFVKQVADR